MRGLILGAIRYCVFAACSITYFSAKGSIPVIEYSEPNSRNGSDAEI